MRSAKLHLKDYEALKASVISDMWFLIKDRPSKSLDMMERKGIPAIITHYIDDQESEILDEIIVEDDRVIAKASVYGEPVAEYKMDEFEIPMLIAILDSMEKHLDKEDKVTE
jgi:predicted XRE-type DNA-binding protein